MPISEPHVTERKLRYQHVYDIVLGIIAEQALAPGDRLPSTTELAEMADVSTISVRRALDELERGGKVVRRQGLGTFVAPPRIASDPTRPGELFQTLLDGGAQPALSTSLISLSVGLPSTSIASALNVDPGQPVWEIWRKRGFEGVSKILERAVLPLGLVPAIDKRLLEQGGSLYRSLMEQYGLADDYTEQSFEVDTASSWEAEQLCLGERDSVVRIRGVSFTDTNVPFDCFEQCYPATEFTFYLAGQTRHRLLGTTELSNWSVTPLVGPTD